MSANLLILYCLGAFFGATGSAAYNHKWYYGGAVWLVGGMAGAVFANWQGLA